MAKVPENYRVKLVYGVGGTGYVVRTDGHVSFFSRDETPLSLTYISTDAAELRFSLIDALDGNDAAKAVRAFGGKSVREVEVLL